MKGAGKKVYVLQKQHEEPELMYMMFDGVFSDEEELVEELRNEMTFLTNATVAKLITLLQSHCLLTAARLNIHFNIFN